MRGKDEKTKKWEKERKREAEREGKRSEIMRKGDKCRERK